MLCKVILLATILYAISPEKIPEVSVTKSDTENCSEVHDTKPNEVIEKLSKEELLERIEHYEKWLNKYEAKYASYQEYYLELLKHCGKEESDAATIVSMGWITKLYNVRGIINDLKKELNSYEK